MNTILVVTLDDELYHHVARALAREGEVTRLAPGDALPRSREGSTAFIILDVRQRERTDAIADVDRYRTEGGYGARCVAIARTTDHISIDIITTFGDEVVALVLAESEDPGHLIRAHLNDSSRSAAAATAYDATCRLLPATTHETLRVVLGGGFRVSSVKQLAVHHDTDRTSIGKALRKVTDWTSRSIIDTAKASYAAMLLRQTSLAPHAIANAVAFGKLESLNDLLKRSFERSARLIREQEQHLSAGDWLERELGALIARRGGGKRLPPPGRKRSPPPLR